MAGVPVGISAEKQDRLAKSRNCSGGVYTLLRLAMLRGGHFCLVLAAGPTFLNGLLSHISKSSPVPA
jgi:hypothetical protein